MDRLGAVPVDGWGQGPCGRRLGLAQGRRDRDGSNASIAVRAREGSKAAAGLSQEGSDLSVVVRAQRRMKNVGTNADVAGQKARSTEDLNFASARVSPYNRRRPRLASGHPG